MGEPAQGQTPSAPGPGWPTGRLPTPRRFLQAHPVLREAFRVVPGTIHQTFCSHEGLRPVTSAPGVTPPGPRLLLPDPAHC